GPSLSQSARGHRQGLASSAGGLTQRNRRGAADIRARQGQLISVRRSIRAGRTQLGYGRWSNKDDVRFCSQGKAEEQAKRCSALVGDVFMDRTIWSERVEHEGKGDVIGDVDKLISLSSLYDDVADVAARGDRCLIERRRLSWLPLEQEIGALDGASAPQQSECPRLVASRHDLDGHHALHRLDAIGKRSVIQEGPTPGRVIADIRITAVIARIGIVRDQYFALRESLSEAIK